MSVSSSPEIIRIPSAEIENLLYEILLKEGVPASKGKSCAQVFVSSSLDGIYSHGINRFKKFVLTIRREIVKPEIDPVQITKIGSMEQWDGQHGIGITNALFCTDRAMEIACEFGIGCVAIANTNHWMRAGTYARHAASNGFIFIGWTNTIHNMPAWGAIEPRLGNNPLVIGVPYESDAIVLDMAMTQYSLGNMELHQMKGEKLAVSGGFDINGELTNNPGDILESGRTLPIGYWKGAGLSLMLDVLATVFSDGFSVCEISKQDEETNVSQVFIAFNVTKLSHHQRIPMMIREIVDDFSSAKTNNENKVQYPGERVLRIREENLKEGIPVLKGIWESILLMK